MKMMKVAAVTLVLVGMISGMGYADKYVRANGAVDWQIAMNSVASWDRGGDLTFQYKTWYSFGGYAHEMIAGWWNGDMPVGNGTGIGYVVGSPGANHSELNVYGGDIAGGQLRFCEGYLNVPAYNNSYLIDAADPMRVALAAATSP